jgi:hypothetical protein
MADFKPGVRNDGRWAGALVDSLPAVQKAL